MSRQYGYWKGRRIDVCACFRDGPHLPAYYVNYAKYCQYCDGRRMDKDEAEEAIATFRKLEDEGIARFSNGLKAAAQKNGWLLTVNET